MSLDTVRREALSLSSDERALLADELWRSVPLSENKLELTPAQSVDLARRREEDDAGHSDPRDWQQVRDELRDRP